MRKSACSVGRLDFGLRSVSARCICQITDTRNPANCVDDIAIFKNFFVTFGATVGECRVTVKIQSSDVRLFHLHRCDESWIFLTFKISGLSP